MTKPPSDAQLKYIRKLGYKRTPPATMEEASVLIGNLKLGRPPKSAESLMRLSPRERTLVYLREHIDQCDSEDRPAGWRIKIPKGAETQENACYQGAFVPFDIGKRHPEVLLLGMVYLGNDDEQQNLDLNPLQRRPSKGPIVTALGVIEQIETGTRKQTVQQQTSKGCGCIFVFFIAVLGLAAKGLFF